VFFAQRYSFSEHPCTAEGVRQKGLLTQRKICVGRPFSVRFLPEKRPGQMHADSEAAHTRP